MQEVRQLVLHSRRNSNASSVGKLYFCEIVGHPHQAKCTEKTGIIPATKSCSTEGRCRIQNHGIEGGMIIAKKPMMKSPQRQVAPSIPAFSFAESTPSRVLQRRPQPNLIFQRRKGSVLTIARPPRTKPVMAFTKLMSLSVIPPAFIMAPAKTNIGIAISENLVDPSYISSASVTILSTPSVTARPKMAATARPTAIGTLIN